MDYTVTTNVSLALENVPALVRMLPHLSEQELVAALELESATLRRKSVIHRLIGRLVALRSHNLRQELEQRYDG